MDVISNMLVTIKNALASSKESVGIPCSNLKLDIVKILKKEGFINDFRRKDKKIEIKFKYRGKKPFITGVKCVSKPGCRIYVKHNKIPSVLRGLGIVIISTPSGVMTGAEAKKKNLGGELICKVW